METLDCVGSGCLSTAGWEKQSACCDCGALLSEYFRHANKYILHSRCFFLQWRFKQLKQATYFLPLSHTLPDAGGGVSLLARRVVRSMYVQVHLCVLGIGVVLGYLEPLDPDLCSHQGGRPLMESAAHCLWD